jgi:hypothetical protein
VIIDQRAVEDTRLSWAARGLLGYLLSRPEDWKVLVKDLQRRGDLGRDGIYKLLKELRTTGYLRFEQARDSQGRIRGGTYYVHEAPNPPHPDMPDTALPDRAAPSPVKPEALLNTQVNLTPTTTTTTTTTTTQRGSRRGDEQKNFTLELASDVPLELQTPARRLVEGLDSDLAQQVIDEWAAIMATGAIHSSPIGYLRGLLKRADECSVTITH